jgi:hypothetical protein
MTASTWMGKQVDSLTLKELEGAVDTVRRTMVNYNKRRDEFTKHDRYKKIFTDGKLPEINPLFKQLQIDLENELKVRTGVK